MKEKFKALKLLYTKSKAYSTYFEVELMPKIEIWVMGIKNIRYIGQDTNVAMES